MHVSTVFFSSLFLAFMCGITHAQPVNATINGNGSSTLLQVNTAGGFDITQVEVDGKVLKEGVDYSIEGNGSSKPAIQFVNAPGFNKKVKVTGVGQNRDPELQLSWGKFNADVVAQQAALWMLRRLLIGF